MEVTMTIHKEGYRWAEPGKVTNATCKVCGADCRIDRNVLGPTNHASAIGGFKRLHDQIVCPHAGSAWHNQAVELKREAETTPSPTLGAILRSDLETLLQQSQPVGA
jgi:hypothetical protein